MNNNINPPNGTSPKFEHFEAKITVDVDFIQQIIDTCLELLREEKDALHEFLCEDDEDRSDNIVESSSFLSHDGKVKNARLLTLSEISNRRNFMSRIDDAIDIARFANEDQFQVSAGDLSTLFREYTALVNKYDDYAEENDLYSEDLKNKVPLQ